MVLAFGSCNILLRAFGLNEREPCSISVTPFLLGKFQPRSFNSVEVIGLSWTAYNYRVFNLGIRCVCVGCVCARCVHGGHSGARFPLC